MTARVQAPIARLFWVAAAFLLSISVGAADLQKAQRAFETGEYAQCLKLAEEGVQQEGYREEWPVLLVKCLSTTGQYPQAEEAFRQNVRRHRGGLRLRLAGYEALRQNGHTEEAEELLGEINAIGGARLRWSQDAENLVATGEAALLLGADPKKVLDRFFEPAKKQAPEYPETYFAAGTLALEKHDFELAAKNFEQGLKVSDTADFHWGLAKAYAPSDRALMLKEANRALEKNPRHIDSLLLLLDHEIDSELYSGASNTVDKVMAINPWHPEAWAYRAVLAALSGDEKGEKSARAAALKFWASNPAVDHLMGKKLSQKYRFREGSVYQRQALALDPGFLQAKLQLAEDLLRLGEETEGWRLAEEGHEKDEYNVTAYNLVTLHDSLNRFETLTNESFVVRMASAEAKIYGSEALELLGRAQAAVTTKYGAALSKPTLVEIFADPKDFAVRTFGMPDNPGYLGVCFGRVITANSPAAQGGHPENWQSILWHEFTHVVTLTLTRNKMPRWLSEGVSVYEERQASPSWGQRWSPESRERVMSGKLTPVRELSAAFLMAKSGADLQFAYFESSLVVEFLAQKYGAAKLKEMLEDLGRGQGVYEAMEKRYGAMSQLEKDFAAYAKAEAKRLGAGLDWSHPKEEESEKAGPGKKKTTIPTPAAVEAWLANKVSPPPTNNFYLLTARARQLVEEKKWKEAIAPLRVLVKEFPENVGAGSPYGFLARAHRELGETNLEKAVLAEWAGRSSDSVEAYLRLMELGRAAGDWAGVRTNAARFLAVNPLAGAPYRYLGEASEKLGAGEEAIRAYETLLLLEPSDPPDIHYRLARLWKKSDAAKAKRHVLMCLEDAPRFRAAHELLLELNAPVKPQAKAAGAPESK